MLLIPMQIGAACLHAVGCNPGEVDAPELGTELIQRPVVDAATKVRQHRPMTQPQPVKVNLIRRPDFREHYANSVQMRVNLWDFYLEFGTVSQTSPDLVNIETFQGIYLSPQQAKALLNVLQQNMAQYESTFGEIKLDPKAGMGVVQ